ncbi:MAG: NUDIX domain-containing protein [Thermoleophilia bacterium]
MDNRRISSRMIYEGGIIRLRLDEVELPNGTLARREIIEHPGAAAVVPLDDDGNVRLVSQYRDAVGERLLEIPAGKLKPGEDPGDCARRELREELGLEARQLDHLATFYSTPGFCDEAMHIYLAQGLSKTAVELDREEFIEPRRLPLEPVAELLQELDDSKSIAGILLAKELLDRRK